MSWWSRIVNVGRGSRLESDLEDEHRFHIEARAEELMARGLSRDEALAEASRRFGHRLQHREASHDVKVVPRLESLIRDLRFGLRLLRKDAVVSLAAIVSLGLAIGACTAAFSLIDALILRELPVSQPDRLVYLSRGGPEKDPRFSQTFSHPFFDRMRQTLGTRMETFSVSFQSLRQALLPDAGGVEEKLRTQFVSGNAFTALGISATIGRVLLPTDDQTAGAHPVAVISHAFWRRRLGGNAHVLGQSISLEQREYQVVGVAQAGFSGVQPGQPTDIWLPNMMFAADSLRAPYWNWLYVWGRLGSGETRSSLQPIATTAFANFDIEHTDNPKRRLQTTPATPIDVLSAGTGLSPVRQQFARPLLALTGIVGVVLLIACSNVANLLLARGAARTREMALRASIGAGRGRLLQQVLVESAALALAAAAVGIVCASIAAPLLVGMLANPYNPVYLDTRIDWRVLGFVVALGSLTTLLFGLVPAFRASGAVPGQLAGLDGRRSTSSAGMARSLVAAQIAFSLMILFVAGLLLRSFDRLLAVDLGFTAERVMLLSVEGRKPFEPDRAREVNQQLLDSMQTLPGVESASISSWALFRGWSNNGVLALPGGGTVQTSLFAVSPKFFHTMGTRMLDGRELEPRDLETINTIPVVVNEAFARKYFPSERAVGRQMFRTARKGETITYEIVGVAANVRDGSVRGEVGPYLFNPVAGVGGAVQVRTSMDPRTLADAVRQELARVDSSLRLVDVTPQSALVVSALLRERLLAVLSGFFAALGLVLAAVGLYGVLSYAVVRRTREIGIRLTLGAQPAAVVRTVLARVAIAVSIGTVIGLAAGAYFARFVRTFLFQTEPFSAASFALPVLCLVIVATIAAWMPARRAARVDPAESLRAE
jgi:predicted permease